MADTSALVRQAKLAAQLQVAPEQSALLELLRQAREGYHTGIKVERGIGQGVVDAAKGAVKPTAQVYYDAGATLRGQRRGVMAQLDKLSPAADPFKAVAADEYAGSQGRRAVERASALKELQDRQVQARAGTQFAAANLRSQYLGSVDKIGTRLSDLGAREGALASDNLGKLVDAEAARRIDEARLRETERANRASEGIAQQNADTSAASAATRAKNGGKKGGLTRAQTSAAFDAIDTAQTWIDRLGHMPTGQIRALLATGGTLTVLNKATGKYDKVPVPKIPKDYINAAFDVKKRGGLSAANIHALHKRGLRLQGQIPLGTHSLRPSVQDAYDVVKTVFGGKRLKK